MPMRWEMILMSNEMNKEMSQGTDVQTEERYQVTSVSEKNSCKI